MRRGPLFRLLGLSRIICASCHRDVLYRGSRIPIVCRWCGQATLDFAAVTRAVERLAAAFGSLSLTFEEAGRAVAKTIDTFGPALYAGVYTVEVGTATHDDLRDGETVTRFSRVQVMARDETEAKLVACQIAARPGRMPTQARVVPAAELAGEREEQRLAEAALRNPLGSAMFLRRRDAP